MDMQLSDEHRALSGKSREFCEQVLQPLELTVEENRGLPASERPALRESVLDWGFAAINHSREDGGAGYNLFEQTLINEQMGRATNGLWSCVWQPPNLPSRCNPSTETEIFEAFVRRRNSGLLCHHGTWRRLGSASGEDQRPKVGQRLRHQW